MLKNGYVGLKKCQYYGFYVAKVIIQCYLFLAIFIIDKITSYTQTQNDTNPINIIEYNSNKNINYVITGSIF